MVKVRAIFKNSSSNYFPLQKIIQAAVTKICPKPEIKFTEVTGETENGWDTVYFLIGVEHASALICLLKETEGIEEVAVA